jgi:hypothetical protein
VCAERVETSNWQSRLIHVVALGWVVSVMLLPAVAQDLNYRLFADQETWLAVPNFGNVVSNLPFVAVGIYGLWRRPLSLSGSARLIPGFVLLCAFVILVGFGSADYHYAPTTDTLIWDRLPISVAFTAPFVCLLIDAVSSRDVAPLIPLVLIGLASIGYRHLTELHGRGDLQPYALVQFLPIIVFPLMLVLFGTKRLRARTVWLAPGGYVLAEIAERYDAVIYTTLGVLSGHSLKHLIAAAAILCGVSSFHRASPQK